MLQEVDKGIRKVVNLQELAHRRAVTPQSHRSVSLGKLADHRREHMTRLQIKVVPGPVEIGRHRADKVGAILLVVVPAELDGSNLGDRLGLVGRLERTGQQIVLAHRLRCKLGIDTDGSQVEELLDARLPGRMDHIGGDLHVLVDKLGLVRVVGEDHNLGFLRFKEGFHVGLPGKVEFVVGPCDHVNVPRRFQPSHGGATDEAAVTGKVGFLLR